MSGRGFGWPACLGTEGTSGSRGGGHGRHDVVHHHKHDQAVQWPKDERAFAQKGDVIFADKNIHSCLWDGIRLSNATVERFSHNSPDDLREVLAASNSDATKMLVIEGVYSMEGHIARLPELSALLQSHGRAADTPAAVISNGTLPAEQVVVGTLALAQELADRGQIGSVITEVLRGKSLTLITERATVTDEAGQPVDVSAPLQQDETNETGEAADAEAGPAASDEAQDSPADASAAEASAAEAGAAEASTPGASAAEAGAAKASAPKARTRKPRAPKAKAAEASAGAAGEGSASGEPGGSTA